MHPPALAAAGGVKQGYHYGNYTSLGEGPPEVLEIIGMLAFLPGACANGTSGKGQKSFPLGNPTNQSMPESIPKHLRT